MMRSLLSAHALIFRHSIAISSSSSFSSSVLRSSRRFRLCDLKFLQQSHELGSFKSAGIYLPKAVPAAGRASGLSDRKRCVEAGMSNAAAAPSRLRNIFVYGSLLAEEVLDVLIKRVPRRVDAYLENFQRYSVRGRVYPAAVPVEGKGISGKMMNLIYWINLKAQSI
ncbi:hypothetical protein O6H91_21G027900 [Diphasiastrum complanatum]|uniref:Uncharacterized protein n=1 Tax=Diphasiastrum complanatum TaxID=34168 RepID=A0ACC2AJ10_DIPCM|nr:hypothetical protein O6H91_21G027900 [Diphasiastrum complanatum]